MAMPRSRAIKVASTAPKQAAVRTKPNQPAPRPAASRLKKRHAKKKARAGATNIELDATSGKGSAPKGAKRSAVRPKKAPSRSKAAKKIPTEKTQQVKRANLKPARAATLAAKKASSRAHQKQGPTGSARVRKQQQAASLTHAAHSAARGRRQQARRDQR